MAKRTDAELVRESLQGSVSAFGEIVERYQQVVCAVAYSGCGDTALSEDVAQEVFVTLWRDLSRLREPSRLRGWLCSIARNRARDALRKVSRETSESPGAGRDVSERSSGDPSPLDDAVSRESERMVWDALQRVPESYREPLVLFYREEQSLKQVASGLGLSIDAVKQRLSRGRQALKEMLGPVEARLAESRPGKAFTVGVIAAVAARAGVASAAASAASAGASAKAAGAGKAVSSGKLVLGGLAAALIVGLLLFQTRETARSGSPADRAVSPVDKAAPTRWRPQPHLPDDPEGEYAFEGQVVDLFERPVAGATVTLSSKPSRVTTTDKEGRFRFERLVARTYGVDARTETAASVPIGVQVGPGTEPVLLRLRPGSSLAITLVDAETREPVEGASLEVESGVSTLTSPTDARGVARFDGLTTSYARVRAQAEGYGPMEIHVSLTGEPGENRRTLALQRGPPVSGSVLDARGAPIAGAKVAVFEQDYGPIHARVETGEDGSFEIPVMPPGDYLLTASHDEHRTLTRPLAIAESAPPPLELVLETGGRVTGVVTTEDGEPVAAALVIAPRERPPKTAIADARGRFSLAGLTPGEVILLADNRGLSSAPKTFELADRQDLGPVTLEVADHSIRGVVVDVRGEPVAGASVHAALPLDEPDVSYGLEGAVDVTNEDGEFHLSPLLPEKIYELFAVAPAVPESYLFLQDQSPKKVRSGEDRVELSVLAPGQIVGEIAFAGGGAPEEFAVAVAKARHRLPGSAATPFSGTGGSFALAALPPGTYVVSVLATGRMPAIVEGVTVESGKPTDLGTVVLERGAALSGRVVDGDGAPVPGARVFAGEYLFGSGGRIESPSVWKDQGEDPYMAAQAPLRVAITDEAGRFSVENIHTRAGHLVVVADHPSRGLSAPSITPAKDSSPRTVVLRRAGSIEGKVTGADGPAEVLASPVADEARRRLGLGQSPVEFLAASGPNGRYRFARLAPGVYELTAVEIDSMKPPSRKGAVRVEVREGRVSRRDLEVSGESAPPWDDRAFERLEAAVERYCACEAQACRAGAAGEISALHEEHAVQSEASFERVEVFMERFHRCAE